MFFPTFAWCSLVLGPPHWSLFHAQHSQHALWSQWPAHCGQKWESAAGSPAQLSKNTPPTLWPWQQVGATFLLLSANQKVGPKVHWASEPRTVAIEEMRLEEWWRAPCWHSRRQQTGKAGHSRKSLGIFPTLCGFLITGSQGLLLPRASYGDSSFPCTWRKDSYFSIFLWELFLICFTASDVSQNMSSRYFEMEVLEYDMRGTQLDLSPV